MRHQDARKTNAGCARHIQWVKRPFFGPLGRYVAVALNGQGVHIGVGRQRAALSWVDGDVALTTA